MQLRRIKFSVEEYFISIGHEIVETTLAFRIIYLLHVLSSLLPRLSCHFMLEDFTEEPYRFATRF
jgi:hypothetical protein